MYVNPIDHNLIMGLVCPFLKEQNKNYQNTLHVIRHNFAKILFFIYVVHISLLCKIYFLQRFASKNVRATESTQGNKALNSAWHIVKCLILLLSLFLLRTYLLRLLVKLYKVM